MLGEQVDEGENDMGTQLLKRKRTGSNILRKLSITGNKKRESIIYKQMKDDDEVDEALLDASTNVRFKRSIIQINRSNSSTPNKDRNGSADEKPGLFQRFRASFKRKPVGRSNSSSPNSIYEALDSGDEDKENIDIIAAQEAEEYNSKLNIADTTPDIAEIISDESVHIASPDSVEGRTAYKFSSETPRRTWKQRIYSSFRRNKHAAHKTKSVSSDTSPLPFKRRYSLPTFRRKKKGLAYEAL